MPIYGYKCTCGESFERFLALKNYDQLQMCDCGQVAEKQMFAARVIGDYAGYTCPITGNWIEGRKAHRENLKANGSRILEPGEVEDAARFRERETATLEDKVANSAEEFLEKLPTKKREQLGRELELGADIAVERL